MRKGALIKDVRGGVLFKVAEEIGVLQDNDLYELVDGYVLRPVGKGYSDKMVITDKGLVELINIGEMRVEKL